MVLKTKRKSAKFILFIILTVFVFGLFSPSFSGPIVVNAVDPVQVPAGTVTNAGIPTTTPASATRVGQGAAAQSHELLPDLNIRAAFENAFKWILYQVVVLFSYFGSVAIAILAWAMSPSHLALLNNDAVYKLWQFVRDFFNLFFILVLLFTAFAMVFQINKYGDKKIILSIVLAALFVNFSFPVSRFLIDLSNVPMYFFAERALVDPAHPEQGLGVVLSASHLQNILIPGRKYENQDFMYLFTAIIVMFLLSVSLLVLAVMFLIRTIGLIIFVIFSSVGFAASVIPALEGYSKQYWEKFSQYLLFGPAAMLMLYVAIEVMRILQVDSSVYNKMSSSAKAAASGDTSFIASMAIFGIPIVLLWFAIGIANKFSIAGAETVTGWGKKVGSLAWKAPLGVARWGGRKAESGLASNRYTKYFSPTVLATAWKQRSEEQKHEDELPIELAAATVQDNLNNVISRTKNSINPLHILPRNWKKIGKNTDHTDHRFATQQSQKGKFLKEIKDVSTRSDYVINELQAAIDTGNSAKAEAALAILASNNDLNDLIVAKGKKYGDGTDVVSSENAKLLIENVLKEAGVSNEEDIAKSMINLSDTALASGNFAFGGMATYDEKGHVFKISRVVDDPSSPTGKRNQQAEQVAAKFSNLEPQEAARKLHPDALFTRDPNGFGDLNGEVADYIIERGITSAVAKQSNRSRQDMQKAIVNAYKGATSSNPETRAKYKNFARQFEGNEKFREYVKEMTTQFDANLGKEIDAKNATLPTGPAPSTSSSFPPITPP